MKTLLILAVSLCATLANAGTFSAFTEKNVLYVTILGDSCNLYSGGIAVSNFCDENRTTRNLAFFCPVTLNVLSSFMACPKDDVKPHVFTINLDDKNIAHEAQTLEITYKSETVSIPLIR